MIVVIAKIIIHLELWISATTGVADIPDNHDNDYDHDNHDDDNDLDWHTRCLDPAVRQPEHDNRDYVYDHDLQQKSDFHNDNDQHGKDEKTSLLPNSCLAR